MPSHKLKPLYQPWDNAAFRSDLHVQRMTPRQRSMYRTLLQEAWTCSTRPYLPDDDDQLWILADAESWEDWVSNMRPIREMFRSFGRGTKRFLTQRRLSSTWSAVNIIYQKRRTNGSLGGRPPKTKELNETTTNQDRTSEKPIEVNVFEVKRSKRTSNSASAQATCGKVENQLPPAQTASDISPPEKEQKDRRDIAARDRRMNLEEQVRREVHVGTGPEPQRQPIGFQAPNQELVPPPPELWAKMREVAGKKVMP